MDFNSMYMRVNSEYIPSDKVTILSQNISLQLFDSAKIKNIYDDQVSHVDSSSISGRIDYKSRETILNDPNCPHKLREIFKNIKAKKPLTKKQKQFIIHSRKMKQGWIKRKRLIPPLEVFSILGDLPIMLHPPSRRCKTPCGCDLSEFKHYFAYLQTLPVEKLLTLIQPQISLYDSTQRSSMPFICKNPDTIDSFRIRKFYEIIMTFASKKFNVFMPVFPYKKVRNIIEYEYAPDQYPRQKALFTIDFLLPCPSSIMGGTCAKKVSLVALHTQSYLRLYTDLRDYIENVVFPFLMNTMFNDYTRSIPFLTKFATYKMCLYRNVCSRCKKNDFRVDYDFDMSFKTMRYGEQFDRTLSCIGRCSSCGTITCPKCKEHHAIDSFTPCPKPPERLTEEEINTIQTALEEDSETSKCPSCSMICVKDDACDKVQCGRVDGGQVRGCGTTFCFRCNDIIDPHHYLSHLVVAQKSDGSDTHWTCRKFTRPCPQCLRLQFHDTTKETIICGSCSHEFTP